ncbi:MAG: DUF6179 domain-containing protein [Hespellia sp.]|nr:DUF6179 domain-containing protein [Hespellia sp.]
MVSVGYKTEELVPIVGELAASYTGYEHSSITYEKAQMLMGAVIYCIREYENAGRNALMSKDIPAGEAYKLGYQNVLEKVEELKHLYHEMIPLFRDYGVECLADTVRSGIPAFFLNYDVKFNPQDTILTLDYPVFLDLRRVSGADAVYRYMQAICCEQDFLHFFEQAYVVQVLKAYHKEYKVLVENVCEILFQNMLGHMMLKKPLADTGLTSGEYERIGEMLSGKTAEKLEEDVNQMLGYVIETFFEHDGKLYDYLKCDSRNIANRIYYCVKSHSLHHIFVL